MIAKYSAGFNLRELLAVGRDHQAGCSELGRQLATAFGVRHVLLFASARAALECVLRAIGGAGAAALPAYNCMAVPEAVVGAGWRPQFVDIAPGSVNMDRQTLQAGLTDDVRAVILTHQFGIPADVEPMLDLCRDRGLFVVEDAAAALGARHRGRLVGMLGDAGILSFGLTKVAPAGRAGVLLTDRDDIARKAAALQRERAGMFQGGVDLVRALAWWALMDPRGYALLRRGRRLVHREAMPEFVVPRVQPVCHAFRPCSDPIARLAGLQFARLDANVAARRKTAQIYREELLGCGGITMCSVPEKADPAWMQFPIFVEHKAHGYEYLLRRGVDLSWTFRYSCGESYGIRTVPNSDKAARRLLGLPTYAGLSTDVVRRICVLLREAVHA